MIARRVCVLLLVLLPAGLRAERTNSVTATVDAVAAMDNNPQVTGVSTNQLPDKKYFTWGLYPALQLDSKGQRSLFNLSYSFGLNRVENTSLDFNSESHSAGMGWTLNTQKLSLRMSERFRKSPDFSTFNLFQGIVFTPEGVFLDYETVALRRDSYENTASVDMDYRVGARSLLTFGGGHSLRDYAQDPLFPKRLPDQSQLKGQFGFKRELTAHTMLTSGYRYTLFNYDTGVYHDGNNHDLYVGVAHSISPTVRLSLDGGPSYTRQFDTNLDYWGYNARVSVSKRFEKEFIDLYYSHDNGASVGVGSISRSDRAGFGFTHLLSQAVSVNFGLSAYKTSRTLDNLVDLKGLSGSMVWNFALNRHLILNLGASYHTQREDNNLLSGSYTSYNDLDRFRVYVSLRFAMPELWRF